MKQSHLIVIGLCCFFLFLYMLHHTIPEKGNDLPSNENLIKKNNFPINKNFPKDIKKWDEFEFKYKRKQKEKKQFDHKKFDIPANAKWSSMANYTFKIFDGFDFPKSKNVIFQVNLFHWTLFFFNNKFFFFLIFFLIFFFFFNQKIFFFFFLIFKLINRY